MIKKDDFDLVLKKTVLKAWEEIQKVMNQFSYFKDLDQVTKRECSIVSRTKYFQPDETIVGDDSGLTNFVHFVSKGTCSIIEHLNLEVSIVNGVKRYKLFRSEREESEEGMANKSSTFVNSPDVPTSPNLKVKVRESKVDSPQSAERGRTILKARPSQPSEMGNLFSINLCRWVIAELEYINYWRI